MLLQVALKLRKVHSRADLARSLLEEQEERQNALNLTTITIISAHQGVLTAESAHVKATRALRTMAALPLSQVILIYESQTSQLAVENKK